MNVLGMNIEATPEQIVSAIVIDLSERGIYLFKKTNTLAENLQFTCPFHADGNERKPSCGMSRNTRRTVNKVHDAGTVHCFTCGYTANLFEFVSDVFGYNDRGKYGKQWVRGKFTSDVIIERDLIDFSRGTKVRDKTSADSIESLRTAVRPFSEDYLSKLRFTHDYMFKRGFDNVSVMSYDIGFDERTNCITFPVRNELGETIFINSRSVSTKFHKYGESDPKTEYLYGIYELPIIFDRDTFDEIAITESIINAITFTQNGIPAVSTMGLGGGLQIELLRNLPTKTLVFAYDPDERGQAAQDKLVKQLELDKLIKYVNYPRDAYDKGLDINDYINNIHELEISFNKDRI